MKRRTKEKINEDREELRKIIENMDSVEKLMKWKNHPYKTDNDLFSVEMYNIEKTRALGWEKTDVLYSFLGVYVIGLVAYYPKEFSRDAFIIKDSNNINIYNLEKIIEIIRDKQNLYKNKKMEKAEILDFNEQLINFIKVYFSIGNVIPTWPGANVDRGCSNMYDIPELYYSKYEIWTRILMSLYKNAFLEDILSPNLVFENNHEINYEPPFWRFESTVDFLDNIINEIYSVEVRKYLYTKWLERIVGIITKRTEQIENELKY